MIYRTGQGELYYVRYAEEVCHEGAKVNQPRPFIDLARQMTEWLNSEFISRRGKNTVDNPDEYERLKGGW